MLDEFGFFFFQVKHDHGPCVSTTRSCFLPNNQTIIKKKMYAMLRRKQNGGRTEKKRRPISLLGSALIFKNAIVLGCSENGKHFFMWLQGMRVRRFPFVPLKKHTIHSVQQWLLLNISLPMK